MVFSTCLKLIYLLRYLDQETAKKLFVLRVKLPPITTSLTIQKVVVILLSALPKDKGVGRKISGGATEKRPKISKKYRKIANTPKKALFSFF